MVPEATQGTKVTGHLHRTVRFRKPFVINGLSAWSRAHLKEKTLGQGAARLQAGPETAKSRRSIDRRLDSSLIFNLQCN